MIDDTYVVVCNSQYQWIAKPLLGVATKMGISAELCVIDEPESLTEKLNTKRCRALILVSVHAVIAVGGSSEIHQLAERLPVVVWNVDDAALTFHALPQAHPNLAVVHVCASSRRFWTQLVNADSPGSHTLGIGPHPDLLSPANHQEPDTPRPIPLLAAMNLHWCGRTLADVEREIQCLPAIARSILHGAAEQGRSSLAAQALPTVVAIAAEYGLELDRGRLRQLTRLCVFQWQLWRREQLIRRLLPFPVVIDSNVIPERLRRGLNVKATLLQESRVGASLNRNRQARVVLSSSFAADLFHDRVLNASLLGATSLTERAPVYRPYFQEGHSILHYDFSEYGIENSVDYILSHPRACTDIASAAQRIVAADVIPYGLERLFQLADLLGDGFLAGRGLIHVE